MNEKNTAIPFHQRLSILNLIEIDYIITIKKSFYAFICIVLDIILTCTKTNKVNLYQMKFKNVSFLHSICKFEFKSA